jgi:membrane protein YqaA with SNARE-associated domain
MDRPTMNRESGEGTTRRGKITRLRHRIDDAARGRWALPVLLLGSVLESTVFPWPLEFPMTAYMLRGKRAAVEVITIVTLGSVVGCFLSYLAGRAAFDALEGFILARPGLEANLELARKRIEDWGPLAVAFAMLAPIPVQAASFAAGLAEMTVWTFLVAVAVGRSARYWAMGAVVFLFGDQIAAWWKSLPKTWRNWGVGVGVAVFIALCAVALVSLFMPAEALSAASEGIAGPGGG